MENQEFSKNANPLEYLKIFFRRKWLLIAPTFAGLVLSIIACFLLPPTYEASTTILVEEEKIINPLIQNLAVSTTAAQRMHSIREILLGWNSLSELSKKLNLAKDIQSQPQFEKLILNLRRNILVNMRPNNIITISYFSRYPQETKLVAESLTEILIERNKESQTKETDVAINFIKEQLAIYKRKIKESEIAQLDEQLKNLLIDSTEQHPIVRELRHKVTIAKQELDSGEYKAASSEQPITDATRKALQNELDRLIKEETTAFSAPNAYAGETEHDANTPIYKLMLIDKLNQTVARDINVNESIYNMLLQKLETAKITQRLEVSREGTRYTVLDPPRLPLKPVKPNKLTIVFLGIFLGGLSGTGLVLGKEFLEDSFLDIDDAKAKLELPILGAISRITTQEEINKEKYTKKKRITISLASSVALILIVMLISFFKR